jgi:hypothetical protein
VNNPPHFAPPVPAPGVIDAEFEAAVDAAAAPPKREPSPVDVATDRALEALVDLVGVTLKDPCAHRFSDAATLCNIGKALAHTRAKSVRDFQEQEVLDEFGNPMPAQAWMGHAGPMPIRRHVHPLNGPVMGAWDGPFLDQGQRRMALAIEPLAEVQKEMQRAQHAVAEADELARLLDLKDRLPEAQRAPLDTRIATLLANLEARNAQQNRSPDDLAHPLDPRRHRPREDGPEVVPPARVRADAERGAGDDGAPGARDEVAPGGGAVGHGNGVPGPHVDGVPHA